MNNGPRRQKLNQANTMPKCYEMSQVGGGEIEQKTKVVDDITRHQTVMAKRCALDKKRRGARGTRSKIVDASRQYCNITETERQIPESRVDRAHSNVRKALSANRKPTN